jgi:dCTP deaminase
MILSDGTIEEHLRYPHLSETITVDPEPTDEQIQPASLDVRLGREVYRFEGDHSVKSPQHRLQPGERYLGHTKETIDLPNHIAAQLAGRSSIGRQGVIVHKTAGWIDPGFEGEITLELMNLGDQPVDLREGERIAQLVFFELDSPSSGYDGSYQQQEGATHAR